MDRGEQVRKEEHLRRVEDLRSRMHKKVDYYAQKPFVEPQQLYHLVREFFVSLLDKEYEPTYQEMVEELEELDHEYLFFTKHQRAAVRDLLESLSETHYSNSQLTEEQTKALLEELKRVISDLTSPTQGNVDHLLHQGLQALAQNDKQKARQCYLKARSLVERMDDSSQQQYRPELEELYSGVKN